MTRIDLPAVLIAGAPPPGGCGPLGPLDGDAGDRLASQAGLTRERLLAGLERYNLREQPGHGVTEPWDSGAAHRAAMFMWLNPDLEPVSPFRGRVVLLTGQRVLRAFAAAVGFPSRLPPLSRLEHAGATWIPLPCPSDRWWNDKDLRERTGAVVRHEVLRAEQASRAWNAFEGPGRRYFYEALSGRVRRVEDDGTHVEIDGCTDDHLLETLARNLGRVLRWGGSSTCTVLAHSVRVAHLAAAVARHLPARPDDATVAACRRLGALHDLHEGLPGVGDVPNPTLRLLRHAVPAIDRIHALAETLVLDLAGARSLLAGLAPAAVRFADRLAACVERAAYFGDAPPWLGPDLRHAGERILRSTLPRTCRRFDDKATPEVLLALFGREYDPNAHLSGWPGWCEDVLACLGSIDRSWQDVLADMVQGAA